MVSWLWKITALQGAFIFKRQNWWCFGVVTWECSTLSLFPFFSPCCNHCHTKLQEKSKVTDLCKIIWILNIAKAHQRKVNSVWKGIKMKFISLKIIMREKMEFSPQNWNEEIFHWCQESGTKVELSKPLVREYNL